MRLMTGLAAAASGATALIHVFGGGPEIHEPIQASELAPLLKGISAVIWHAITAILVVNAFALLWCARDPNRPLEVTILAVQLSFIGLFWFYGLTMFGTLMQMPQWILFGGISILIVAGWRPRSDG